MTMSAPAWCSATALSGAPGESTKTGAIKRTDPRSWRSVAAIAATRSAPAIALIESTSPDALRAASAREAGETPPIQMGKSGPCTGRGVTDSFGMR